MNFILLLTIGTLLIGYLTFLLWKKTKEISFLIGIFFLFYWTLLGGWLIVIDHLTGMHGECIGLHYYHFFDKLFPVNLDRQYFYALFQYILFLVLIISTMLFFCKKNDFYKSSEHHKKINISNISIILISLISLFFSFLIIHYQIMEAIEKKESLYLITRHGYNKFFSLHQIFNHIAIVSILSGFVINLSSKNPVLFKSKNNWLTFVVYSIVILITILYLILLGNKHDLIFAGMFGILLYLYNSSKIQIHNIIFFLVIAVTPIFLTDTIRGLPILNFIFEKEQMKQIAVSNNIPPILSIFFSNEIFCAHMSMYGAIKFNIPLTHGSSFINLFASLIPKFIIPNRPDDIYTYYANAIHAMSGQGYTIHHATGWYLNFGICGTIIGACIFGFIWIKSFQLKANAIKYKHKFFKILSCISPFCITAYIPLFIRNGIEGYRALIYEAILIPTLILFIASLKIKFKQH